MLSLNITCRPLLPTHHSLAVQNFVFKSSLQRLTSTKTHNLHEELMALTNAMVESCGCSLPSISVNTAFPRSCQYWPTADDFRTEFAGISFEGMEMVERLQWKILWIRNQWRPSLPRKQMPLHPVSIRSSDPASFPLSSFRSYGHFIANIQSRPIPRQTHEIFCSHQGRSPRGFGGVDHECRWTLSRVVGVWLYVWEEY